MPKGSHDVKSEPAADAEHVEKQPKQSEEVSVYDQLFNDACSQSDQTEVRVQGFSLFRRKLQDYRYHNSVQVNEPGSMDPYLSSTTAHDVSEEKQVKVTTSEITTREVSSIMNQTSI